MANQKNLDHFILTRFNLLLWSKDKNGNKVRSKQWLEHRFALFELYCLTSIKNQTCQDFEWIVLFDSTTPYPFKKKVEDYKKECPQLIPIYVEPHDGQYFADIFRKEVAKKLNAQRVITTYLDNDDALSIHFVEDLQKRVESLSDGTFISYTDGYQYYTDHKNMMRIHYPRNHFMSVVEAGDHTTIKTIYGYGSHYYIEKIPGVRIENVKNLPMWCEVIHEKNMGNDAYFFNAKMINESDNQNENILAKDFGFQVEVNNGVGLYLFRYLPRYFKTFIRRCGFFIFRNRFE